MSAGFHCFTGPPGAGKSSVLAALAGRCRVVEEPARAVLAEQRATGGRGTGEQDAGLFVALMLARAEADHRRMSAEAGGPVLFDRALPDLIGYCAHYGLDDGAVRAACGRCAYGGRVFWFPHWPEIYAQDEERRASAAQAAAFGELVAEGYRSLGYTLVEVPAGPVAGRAAFIAERTGL